MAENYSDFSPFNYVFSNPLSFIDPSGMSAVGDVEIGYGTTSGKNISGSIDFAFFGSSGGPSDDPAKKKSNSGMLPGANTDRVVDTVTDFVPFLGSGKDMYRGYQTGNYLLLGLGVGGMVLDVFTLGGSSVLKGTIKTVGKEIIRQSAEVAIKNADKIKYIGRLDDLKSIPRKQTLLDDLPNLGNPKANYKQNMSVLRKAIRDGFTIKDASWFRPNSELAPTIFNPKRTVGQTFLGAERLLLKSKKLWP